MGMFDKFKAVNMDMTSDQVGPVGVSESIKNLAIQQNAEQDLHAEEISNAETQDVIVQTSGKAGIFKRVPLSMLSATPAEWNRFTPVSDRKKLQIADSIIRTGLQQPIVVREIDSEPTGYQILAGNTRTNIYSLIYEATHDEKYSSIPAIVYKHGEINDETARQIIVDTNYAQRGELPKKDKAFAAHEKLSFLRKHYESSPLDKAASMLNISRAVVYRWECAYNLIDQIFELYEKDIINLMAAARLGTFPKDIQMQLAEESDYLTNNIILQIPAKTKPENVLNVFHSIIEKMTTPVQEEKRPECTWKIERTTRAFHATIKGKHEGYEPFVLLLPDNKVKKFLKAYEEFVLKNTEPEVQ